MNITSARDALASRFGWSWLRSIDLSVSLPLLLLVLALVCGGSNASYPIRDMILQLFALIVLATALSGWLGKAFSPDWRLPMILIGSMVVLVVFQLIPLPVSIWTSLDGRAASVETLRLIGEPLRAMPLSLQPEKTLQSGLALLPGVAMAVAVLRLGARERLVLAGAVVFGALASLVIGVLQAAAGEGARVLNFYNSSHGILPIGVFANTNHQADLLVISFVFTGVLLPRVYTGKGGVSAFGIAKLAIMTALAVGVVATGSRTGIALLALSMPAILLRERLKGHVGTVLLGVIGLAAVVALLIAFSPVFARSFADFSDLNDPRFHFWPNVLYAIDHFGLMGTGLGTFDGVYRSVETLDTLSARYLNHAHNDFLELLLETGVPGVILFLGFLGFWIGSVVTLMRRTDRSVSVDLAFAGMIGTGVLLLHSVVDYPLRTGLLAIVFGLCCALMTRPPVRMARDDVTL